MFHGKLEGDATSKASGGCNHTTKGRKLTYFPTLSELLDGHNRDRRDEADDGHEMSRKTGCDQDIGVGKMFDSLIMQIASDSLAQ